MNSRSKIRPPRGLALEPLEARTLMAWKVLAADAETLTIGNPDDGDVGVLSYDPVSDEFLLNGLATGVNPQYRGPNLPSVTVKSGQASNTTFVIDVSAAAFPPRGVCAGFCTPPGAWIAFDGNSTSRLRLLTSSDRGGLATVRPFRTNVGSISFDVGFASNYITYDSGGGVSIENFAIVIDTSGDSMWTLGNPPAQVTRVWDRHSFIVAPDRISVAEHLVPLIHRAKLSRPAGNP